MKRVMVLLAVTAILAGCPRPPTVVVEKEATLGYPQLAALFSQPNKAATANTLWLQRLADYYDIGVFWPDAQGWYVDGVAVPAWVQQRSADFVALAYAPAGYWWVTDDSCATTPVRCEVRALLDNNDWWLHAPSGDRVQGWAGQALIDTPRAASGLNAFWAQWYKPTVWDGMAWDVTDGNMHYVGGTVDFDRNGKPDNTEHGFQWLDDTWTLGLRNITAGIGAASIGNGAWMPRQADELSQLAPPLGGSIVELPSRWRNPETGRWEPSAPGDLISWHITNLLALRQRDPDSTYLILAKPDLFATTYWQRYLPDRLDQQRLAFGVALLTDSAALQIAYGNVPWCDECGVSGGSTSWRRNWLGQPLEPAQRSVKVWWRAFENGAVYVNAGEQAVTLQDVPAGLQQINGWYDREHNSGGLWDGRLEPYETLVLWRKAPAPADTPTPLAVPTSQPADSLPERIESLERRIEAIERVFDSWEASR